VILYVLLAAFLPFDEVREIVVVVVVVIVVVVVVGEVKIDCV